MSIEVKLKDIIEEMEIQSIESRSFLNINLEAFALQRSCLRFKRTLKYYGGGISST